MSEDDTARPIRNPERYKAWRAANPDFEKTGVSNPVDIEAWRKAEAVRKVKWTRRVERNRDPKRKSARNAAQYAVRSGKLIIQPCEVCGTTKQIEAHHDDYSKPLKIRWLCRKHHRQHHQNEG